MKWYVVRGPYGQWLSGLKHLSDFQVEALRSHGFFIKEIKNAAMNERTA